MAIERVKLTDKPIPSLSDNYKINKDSHNSHVDAENNRREQINNDILNTICNMDPSLLEKVWLLITNGDTVIKLAYYVILIVLKIKGLSK